MITTSSQRTPLKSLTGIMEKPSSPGGASLPSPTPAGSSVSRSLNMSADEMDCSTLKYDGSNFESFFVQSMIFNKNKASTSTPIPNKRVIKRNAELITSDDFLTAIAAKEAATSEKQQRAVKKRNLTKSFGSPQPSCSKAADADSSSPQPRCSKDADAESSSSRSSLVEMILDDDSDDNAMLSEGEEAEYSNSTTIYFNKRKIPRWTDVEVERLYVVGFFDSTRTKLYIGKIKEIKKEEDLLVVEFMNKQSNDKFTWKSNPPTEDIKKEQLLIGPLSVHYDYGIYVHGLARARELYMKYVTDQSLHRQICYIVSFSMYYIN